MSKPIEEYALIGDCRSAALVARDGSIDWLCLPRFDSSACFAALLGTEKHGFWKIAPADENAKITRRYLDDTLILETRFETESGIAVLIDFMPPITTEPFVIRVAHAVEGEIQLQTLLRFRLDYGSMIPWVHETEGGFAALAGPDMFQLHCDQPLKLKNNDLVGSFRLRKGESRNFLLSYQESHQDPKSIDQIDSKDALKKTEEWWTDWSSKCTYKGEFRDAVVRSLITLKALTYEPTGGIIAAPTTSLPEDLDGVRNWDYRYCWIRDASLVLHAFLQTGYPEEARRWNDWLLRSVAAEPEQMRIMYGASGERRILESELPWLPGYENSKPVRIGNVAYDQFQLDVYGEVMLCYYYSLTEDLPCHPNQWELLLKMMDFLKDAWKEKDEGIWEVRGEQNHFTYSKFMCWVAFDHAIRAAEKQNLDAPVEEWKQVREEIREDICTRGFREDQGAFVQAYGTDHLDASLLRMTLLRFLPPQDPRIQKTVQAIEEHLINDEFVFRYYPSHEVDGLPGEEGAFLLCCFWLADNYVLMGRHREAREMFERLLSIRNDVGLLSEEYDANENRLIGNFPQAFSHVGLILTALNLENPDLTDKH